MSVGNHPGGFRTYLTADGGRHWTITNQNTNPQAFYDCMAFFDREHGLILSDPVNGRFRILITANGGQSWRVDPARERAEGALAQRVRVRGQQRVHHDLGHARRLVRQRRHPGIPGVPLDGRRRELEGDPDPAPSGRRRRHVRARVPLRRQGLAIGGDFASPRTRRTRSL